MRKYWLIFKLNLAEAFVYRTTGLIWFLVDFGPSLVLIIFWLAAFESRQFIAGYSLSQMLLYYIGVSLISTIVVPHPQYWIKDNIMSGQFSMIYLLKPVSLFWERWAAQTSWRVIRLLFMLPATALLVYWLSQKFDPIYFKFSQLGILAAALLLAFIGQLFFKICLGLASIWFGETAWLVNFWDIGMALLGGGFFPLVLYPQSIQILSHYLPFRYFFYFPLSILLGDYTVSSLTSGFLGLMGWVILGWLVYRVVFKYGVRHYSAFGG